MNTDAESVSLAAVREVNEAEIVPSNTFSLSVNSLILSGFGE